MTPARTALLAAALLTLVVAPAAATPVASVSAARTGDGLAVSARVVSPPGGGCEVRVTAGWSRIPDGPSPAREAARAAPSLGAATGLVRKTGADGAVGVDACRLPGAGPMVTEGLVRLQFRPGRLAPGAYRVCVRAVGRTRDGDAHRACTVLRVPAVAPAGG